MATKKELEAENKKLKAQLAAAVADVKRMAEKLAASLEVPTIDTPNP